MRRDYEIIRSKRKTIAIEIKEDGSFIVRAPNRVPVYEINEFVESKRDWIKAHSDIQKEKHEREIRYQMEHPTLKLSEGDIKALKESAKKTIPERVAFFAKRIGVDYSKITIRCQSTMWGSCSGKCNLSFNVLLMLTPVTVMDYVIIHELCHCKEHNHSKRFWENVKTALPEYEECEKWLRQNGKRLLNAVPDKMTKNN